MSVCRACKRDHDPRVRCEVAQRVSTTKDKPLAPVSTTVSTERKGDRHKPGYMREFMKVWRAIKSGRAMPLKGA